ncbi:MAG: tetratricopeptide repeat protein [Candidatus Hydrogenedentes bacterium]|nr:tetratricopeptide repeat protein [Candidatus Hydrogenedentota bacterium]
MYKIFGLRPFVLVKICFLIVLLFPGCKIFTAEHTPNSSLIEGANSEDLRKGKSYAHYLSSVVYYRKGDLNKSIEELEKSIENADEEEIPSSLFVRLVRLYIIAERYEDALRCVDKILLREPSPSLYLIQGELYHRLGRFDEAVSAFQKAIELNPEDILGYTALLDLQEKTNDLVSAIEIYQRMIQNRPDNALLHYQLGLTYARIKSNSLAIQSLEKALQLDPRMIRAHYILALLYLDEKFLDKSKENLEKYISRKPDDPKGWEVLMGVYVQLGEFEKGKDSAKKLAKFANLTPLQKLLLSFFYSVVGDSKTSLSFLPVSEYPVLSKVLEISAKEVWEGVSVDEIASLDNIGGNLDLECNDFISGVWNNFGENIVLGWFAERLNKIDQSKPSLTISLIRSRILLVAERYQDAVGLLEKAFVNYEKDLWVNYYLAMGYEKLKRYEDAEKHLKICLELDPENGEILNFLGYLYADLNIKLEEAENLIRRALKIDPENPYYLDSMGWVYYRKGNADEAITYIKKAIYKMDTDDAVLRDHLGDAYLLKGDVKRAIAEWKRALFLDPKNEEIKKKIEKYEKE